jgi:uncharacterized protein with PIN domain
VKFITDKNLGRLTKWLRILGHDTLYYRGDIDRNFLRAGAKESRIVLTRRRDMAKRNFSGHMTIIHNDKIHDQIRELQDKTSLTLDSRNFFSICIECNQKLQTISKNNIAGRVPPYVFQTQETFLICPACEKLYWPGTHKDRIFEFLKDRNLFHRP